MSEKVKNIDGMGETAIKENRIMAGRVLTRKKESRSTGGGGGPERRACLMITLYTALTSSLRPLIYIMLHYTALISTYTHRPVTLDRSTAVEGGAQPFYYPQHNNV